MNPCIRWIAGAVVLFGLAEPALADDSDLRAEVEVMKRKLEAQDRKLRELVGRSLTQDDVTSAVQSYLAASPSTFAVFVGGGGDRNAGFPLGKKPFIEEGPNRLEIGFRNQVRYEAFLYSNHAKGTLSDAGNPFGDAAPRNRSGFEIERLLVDLGGSIFCKDITYLVQFDFDTDSGSGIQKRFAYLDWKYSGEHHVRAGSDRVPFGYEPNNSSGSLAFVDRSVVASGYDLGWSTGIEAWGYFGDCQCPKRFLYRVQAANGEGRIDQEGGAGLGSVFNRDAFDTYSDNLLFAGLVEWNVTGAEFKWDEVDSRDCDKRACLYAAIGASAYYEDDNDAQHGGWGNLVVRSMGRAERAGLNAWFRAAWQGVSFVTEGYYRSVDYTDGSTAPTQSDVALTALLHYRFPYSNWGFGLRAGVIWLDDDYRSVTVGPAGNTTTVSLDDRIRECGLVVNYFFWDHNNKVSLDVNRVQGNSGVSSTTQGYLVSPAKGVVVEDGWMLRLQWQIAF